MQFLCSCARYTSCTVWRWSQSASFWGTKINLHEVGKVKNLNPRHFCPPWFSKFVFSYHCFTAGCFQHFQQCHFGFVESPVTRTGATAAFLSVDIRAPDNKGLCSGACK